MLKKIISLVLLVLWCLVIFSFSNDSGDKSSNKSDSIVSSIMKTDKNDKKFSNYSFWFRKSCHVMEYVVLIILTINCFKVFNVKYYLLVSIIFSSLFAISDEIHQLFIPGRSCEIRDMIIDISAILVISFIYKARCLNEKDY